MVGCSPIWFGPGIEDFLWFGNKILNTESIRQYQSLDLIFHDAVVFPLFSNAKGRKAIYVLFS